MNKKKEPRKYQNDDFKINCIYNKEGKTIFNIIEEAFKNYYEVKTKI